MPFRWIDDLQEAPDRSGAFSHLAGDAPVARLQLWPYRSLPPKGFALFIGSTAVLFLLPLLATLGTNAHWVLLVFILSALALIWIMLRTSYHSARLVEELTLWPDRIQVVRHEANGTTLKWEANPYWVTIQCRSDGPVPAYLTLRGNGREIELGAFLSEAERETLFKELSRRLADVTRLAPQPQPPEMQNGDRE
jgi:uncharacterized membrane protein